MTLHFTPTSGSWLNLVEAFFSILTRQALRRGNFPTVADLIAAIERFIDAWNDRCAPFTWTKDPDTVIAKATDPQLEAKIRDVVGLYLHPPAKAVVLCVDEKPQIQAL